MTKDDYANGQRGGKRVGVLYRCLPARRLIIRDYSRPVVRFKDTGSWARGLDPNAMGRWTSEPSGACPRDEYSRGRFAHGARSRHRGVLARKCRGNLASTPEVGRSVPVPRPRRLARDTHERREGLDLRDRKEPCVMKGDAGSRPSASYRNANSPSERKNPRTRLGLPTTRLGSTSRRG